MNSGDLLPLILPPPTQKIIVRAWSKILSSLIVTWKEKEIRSEQEAWLCEVITVFIRESAAFSQAS